VVATELLLLSSLFRCSHHEILSCRHHCLRLCCRCHRSLVFVVCFVILVVMVGRNQDDDSETMMAMETETDDNSDRYGDDGKMETNNFQMNRCPIDRFRSRNVRKKLLYYNQRKPTQITLSMNSMERRHYDERRRRRKVRRCKGHDYGPQIVLSDTKSLQYDEEEQENSENSKTEAPTHRG